VSVGCIKSWIFISCLYRVFHIRNTFLHELQFLIGSLSLKFSFRDSTCYTEYKKEYISYTVRKKKRISDTGHYIFCAYLYFWWRRCKHKNHTNPLCEYFIVQLLADNKVIGSLCNKILSYIPPFNTVTAGLRWWAS